MSVALPSIYAKDFKAPEAPKREQANATVKKVAQAAGAGALTSFISGPSIQHLQGPSAPAMPAVKRLHAPLVFPPLASPQPAPAPAAPDRPPFAAAAAAPASTASVAKITPLMEAIDAQLTLKEIEKLIHNDSVNAIDPQGMTALLRAIAKGNLALVRLLVVRGAKTNRLEGTPFIPICAAIFYDRKEIATVLVRELGADPNQMDGRFALPLEFAILTEKEGWDMLLMKLGADPLLLQEHVDRKELAHVWSYAGFSILNKNILSLEGWMACTGAKMLEGYLSEFVKKNPQFKQSQREELLECLQNMVHPHTKLSNAQILERCLKGLPTVFFTEWGGEYAHTTSQILVGGKLYVANRGCGRDPKYGIVAYTLDLKDLTLAHIEHFRKSHAHQEAYNKSFDTLNLKRTLAECIVKRDQEVNNCVWSTGAKGAALVLFRHYGKDLYKEFTAFCRIFSLKTYLDQTTNPDRSLLKFVVEKFKRKAALHKKGYSAAALVDVMKRLPTPL